MGDGNANARAEGLRRVKITQKKEDVTHKLWILQQTSHSQVIFYFSREHRELREVSYSYTGIRLFYTVALIATYQ